MDRLKREARALHWLTTPRLSKTNKYSRRQRGSAVEEQAQEGLWARRPQSRGVAGTKSTVPMLTCIY